MLAGRDGGVEAAALGLQRGAQGHEDQRVAAELRRLRDLQDVVGGEGEDRGEALKDTQKRVKRARDGIEKHGVSCDLSSISRGNGVPRRGSDSGRRSWKG